MNTDDDLNRLAERIKASIAKLEQGRAAWREGALELAEELNEGRRRFKADIAFGKWFDEQAFNLDEHTRAAYITMGQDLVLARDVLEKTDRWSIRLICKHEFEPRFGNAAKPTETETTEPPKRKRRTKAASTPDDVEVEKLAREGIGRDEIVKKVGVGPHKAQLAIKKEEGRQAGLAEAKARAEAKAAAEREAALEAQADEVVASLPEAKQMKAREALERLEKRQEREFERRVEGEIGRRLQDRQRLLDEAAEARRRQFERDLREAAEMRRAYKGIFTEGEFKTVLRCLHPDTGKHVDDTIRAEAFRLVSEKKTVLVKAAPKGPPLPTLEEQLSRRAQAEADKQAKRKGKNGSEAVH